MFALRRCAHKLSSTTSIPRVVSATTTRNFQFTAFKLVKAGDSIPNIELVEGAPDKKVNIAKELASGKGIIVGVPAAFSPACTASHVPGYINHKQLKSAGKVFIVAILEVEHCEGNGYKDWLVEQKRQLSALLPRPPRCRILQLPAEIREIIWIHAVTEWAPRSKKNNEPSMHERSLRSQSRPVDTTGLVKSPIRMDRFNRPLPPALTSVCHQIRHETLHLYYQQNIFECWRPLFWHKDWSTSTLIDWLLSLGSHRVSWLREINLLYKHENELEHDILHPLLLEGFPLHQVTVTSKRELSEYEMCFEELGLPRHFGTKRRSDRWRVGVTS